MMVDTLTSVHATVDTMMGIFEHAPSPSGPHPHSRPDAFSAGALDALASDGWNTMLLDATIDSLSPLVQQRMSPTKM